MNSIELTGPFHMARRIAKVVAPDFRVFATNNLAEGQTVLDLKSKTIEVSENTEQQSAIASVLFQLGHLRLRNAPELKEHFGKIIDINEKRLVNKLVRQGIQADALAVEWASQVMRLIFDVTEQQANELVGQYAWSDDDWREYYSL